MLLGIGAALGFGVGLAGFIATDLLLFLTSKLRPKPYQLLSVLWETATWQMSSLLAAFFGLSFLSIALFPRIKSFVFDAETQNLVVTDLRLGRKPRTRCWPFDAITSVRPRLTTTYATKGDFEVTLRDERGEFRSMSLGDQIPIAELRRHSARLRDWLPTQVQSTLRQDL